MWYPKWDQETEKKDIKLKLRISEESMDFNNTVSWLGHSLWQVYITNIR